MFIPTIDLALIKDGPAKRAVTDYFLKQGKLTGADSFAIVDKKTVEIYGAEEETLYEDSLSLIRGFSTEENRGTLLELTDQLQLAKENVYNQALMAFESNRMKYRDGEISSRAYQYYLTNTAEKNSVAVYPAGLAAIKANRELNYHEKQIHEEYLEYTLLNFLAATKEEKQLVNYQYYTDIIERIINISASSQDLRNYKKAQSALSLSVIAKYLDNQLGDNYIDMEKEMAKVSKAINQGLDFYQLAEKRNHAIYGNTLQRLKSRNEKTAVVITGGFHTDEISRMAKKQGHSVVIVQPNLSGAQYSSNYYNLLIHPDRSTAFEKMLVRAYGNSSAVAAMNFVANNGFRALYVGMVEITKAAMAKRAGKDSPISVNVSLKKIADDAVKVTATDGTETSRVIKMEKENVEVMDAVEYAAETETAQKPKNIGSYLNTNSGFLKGMVMSGLVWSGVTSSTAITDFTKSYSNDTSTSKLKAETSVSMKGINLLVSKGVGFVTSLFKVRLKPEQTQEEQSKGPIEKITSPEKSNVATTAQAALDLLTATPIAAVGRTAAVQAAFQKPAMTVDIKSNDKEDLLADLQVTEAKLTQKREHKETGKLVESGWQGDEKHDKPFVGDFKTLSKAFVPYEALDIQLAVLTDFFAQEENKSGDVGLIASSAEFDLSMETWEQKVGEHRPELGDDVANYITEAIEALIKRYTERQGRELSEDERKGVLSKHRLIIPTIRIMHCLKGQTVIDLTRAYNPHIEITNLFNQQLEGTVTINGKTVPYNRFFQLLDEIVDPVEKQKVQNNLLSIYTHSSKNPISFQTKDGQPNEELITQTYLDLIIHELTHTDLWHYSQDEYERFDAAYENLPKGFLEFKNSIKATYGAENFRKIQVDRGRKAFNKPNKVSELMYKILKRNESICDLLGIRLIQRANEKLKEAEKPLLQPHIHEQFGQMLTPDMVEILDVLINRMIDFSTSDEFHHLVYSTEHLNDNESYKNRGVVAAFNMINTAKQVPDSMPLSHLINSMTEKLEVDTVDHPVNISTQYGDMSIEEMIAGYTSQEVKQDVIVEVEKEKPTQLHTEDSIMDILGDMQEMQVEQNIEQSNEAENNLAKISDEQAEAELDDIAAVKLTGNAEAGVFRSSESAGVGNAFLESLTSDASQPTEQTQSLTESNPVLSAQRDRFYPTGGELSPGVKRMNVTENPLNTNTSRYRDTDPAAAAAATEVLITELADVIPALSGEVEASANFAAAKRAQFALGHAAEMLGRIDQGLPLTIGVDSPDLARVMQETKAKMAAADPDGFGTLVGRFDIKLFPNNSEMTKANNRDSYSMPSNWAKKPTLAVYSIPSTAANQYSSFQIGKNTVAKGTAMLAVPIQVISTSFTSPQELINLLNIHKGYIDSLDNKDAFDGLVIINPKQLTTSQKALLQHYLDNPITVTGFKKMSQKEQAAFPIEEMRIDTHGISLLINDKRRHNA